MLIKCAVDLDNLKLKAGDFPGGPVVKNPLANQYREHGFDPWFGKIPRASEQLSPFNTSMSLRALEPRLCNKRSQRNEKPEL